MSQASGGERASTRWAGVLADRARSSRSTPVPPQLLLSGFCADEPRPSSRQTSPSSAIRPRTTLFGLSVADPWHARPVFTAATRSAGGRGCWKPASFPGGCCPPRCFARVPVVARPGLPLSAAMRPASLPSSRPSPASHEHAVPHLTETEGRNTPGRRLLTASGPRHSPAFVPSSLASRRRGGRWYQPDRR